jgi:cbb3-type cytochrome oxidase maturation protein
MEALFVLLTLSLLLGGGFLAAFLWAARSGQFDDAVTPAWRALQDAPASPTSPVPPDPSLGEPHA